jgi:hypothetical protein
VYSYKDRALAGDVKALRAEEVDSINHCFIYLFKKGQSVGIEIPKPSDLLQAVGIAEYNVLLDCGTVFSLSGHTTSQRLHMTGCLLLYNLYIKAGHRRLCSCRSFEAFSLRPSVLP